MQNGLHRNMKTTISENESLRESRQQRKLSIGDPVRFSAKWLRGTGQYTGPVPHAKGIITDIEPGKGIVLATVDWGKSSKDVPAKVLISNLVHEDDVKFEEGHACISCGALLHEDGFGQPEWLAKGHIFAIKHDGIPHAVFASDIDEARNLASLLAETGDESLPVAFIDEQLKAALNKLSSNDVQAIRDASTEVARKLRGPKGMHGCKSNPFEIERDPCDPYEIWLKRDGKKLFVLKKYQCPGMEPPDLTICPACLPDLITGMNPDAKWLVYDPDTEEKQNMFARDVIFNAVRVKDFPFQREHPIDAEIAKGVIAYNNRGSNTARMTVRNLSGVYTLFIGDKPIMNGDAQEVADKIKALFVKCLPDVDAAHAEHMANQKE